MTEQPRDSDGKFVEIDTRGVENPNDQDTVGECLDEHVKPSVDYINVNLDYLEEAIERAKNHDDLMSEEVVRIGTMSKTQDHGDRTSEKGMVFVKPNPSSDRVMAVVGLTREWSNDDE